MRDISTQADAIVIGAGLNGSWVAKSLTEAGMRVTLIDAGAYIDKAAFTPDQMQGDQFYAANHLFRLKLIIKGSLDKALNRSIDKKTSQFFLDRRLDPYLTPFGANFSWRRVRAVGGRGHFWGRVMLRTNDLDLNLPGSQWPISSSDLAPFYDEIEETMQLGGAASTMPQVPDGRYAHNRTLNSIEQKFCDIVSSRWPERRAVVNHVAQYEPGPLSPMLEAAVATGRLTLRAEKIVTSMTIDAAEVTGVQTVCAKTGRLEQFKAPKLFVAASAFETLRIMLNSRSSAFPKGVGNGRGLLGSRILEHVDVQFFGQLPSHIRPVSNPVAYSPFKLNAEPHGFYMPPFSCREAGRAGRQLGFGVQGTISMGSGLVYLGGFGETVPNDKNTLVLSDKKTDRYGVPVAKIRYSWNRRDRGMRAEMENAITEMIREFSRVSGIKIRSPLTKRLYDSIGLARPAIPGSSHECGGARMGSDPDNSVVDAFNRVWEAPNVYVCDLACFPSLFVQNPTLTSMAIALRASKKAADDN